MENDNSGDNYSNDSSGEKISLYNSGVAQIRRLDELWVKIHKYAEAGELIKWNWGLDRIWCELVGDIAEDKDDDNELEKEKEKTKEQSPTEIFNSFKLTIGSLNKKIAERIISLSDYQKDFYDILMDKEAFLRRLQNKQGKGTKLVDADEDDFE